MPTPFAQRLSRTLYTTDGVTTNWDFAFSDGYLDQAHVKARVDTPAGVRTEITVTPGMLVGPFQLQITPALAAGDILTIYRDTPKDAPLVNFSDESGFSEIALDTNARQAVMVAAETADEVNTSDIGVASEAAIAAATSAAAALSSQTAAASSAVVANSAKVAAEAALDSFDDRYLGAKANDPALDNDGAALLVGSLYWNTVASELRVYTGAGWLDTGSALANAPVEYTFNGTGAQTLFTLATTPASSKFVAVTVGGVLQESSSYTLVGAALTFSEAPPVGTGNVDVTVFTPASLADAATVAYSPSGTGAVPTTVQAKLRESVSVKDFGAVGDGVADDTEEILLAVAEGPSYVPEGNFKVSGIGGAWVMHTAPYIYGEGTLKTAGLSESVFSVGSSTTRISGAVIEGLTFTQPNDPAMSGGTANNHFCVNVGGSDDSRISNLKFVNPDLCLSVGYGNFALGDRACYRNVVTNIVGYGVRGMGLQLFGSKQGTYTNLAFEGTDGSTGRAMFHGLRLSAINTTPNLGNIVELTAKKFATGVSLQQHGYHNQVTVYAEDCTVGVQVHGQAEGVTTGVSTNNVFNVTAKNCAHAVYEGGASNTFNINADGCTVGGLFADLGTGGLAENNRYTGTIRNTVGRLAEIKASRSSFDLTLEGVGATSTYGLLLQGNNNSGRVVVSDCDVGVRVTGSNNNVDVNITGSTSAALQITGNNNTVTGYITGTITNTGTGNRFNASGSFTPSLLGSSTPGTYTAGGADVGTWVREGRFVRFYLGLNGTITGQAGTLMLEGLPFKQSQGGYYFFRNDAAAFNGYVSPRTTSGSTATQITLTGMTYTSGNTIIVSGVYVAE